MSPHGPLRMMRTTFMTHLISSQSAGSILPVEIKERPASLSHWAHEAAWAESKIVIPSLAMRFLHFVIVVQGTRLTHICSFAFVEMNLILAKLHFRYDLELVDPRLDWEGQSTLHVMWSKPELLVKIKPRP